MEVFWGSWCNILKVRKKLFKSRDKLMTGSIFYEIYLQLYFSTISSSHFNLILHSDFSRKINLVIFRTLCKINYCQKINNIIFYTDLNYSYYYKISIFAVNIEKITQDWAYGTYFLLKYAFQCQQNKTWHSSHNRSSSFSFMPGGEAYQCGFSWTSHSSSRISTTITILCWGQDPEKNNRWMRPPILIHIKLCRCVTMTTQFYAWAIFVMSDT